MSKHEDEFLDDVDSAAIDSIEEVRDILTKKAIEVRQELTRPSVLYRPLLTKTATKSWKAAYGEFQAFGATPDLVMKNFDIEWMRRTA